MQANSGGEISNGISLPASVEIDSYRISIRDDSTTKRKDPSSVTTLQDKGGILPDISLNYHRIVHQGELYITYIVSLLSVYFVSFYFVSFWFGATSYELVTFTDISISSKRFSGITIVDGMMEEYYRD